MPNIKKTILLGFLALTTMGVSFGYFEDSMYCNITSKNIYVSLKKEDGSKCTSYTQFIEQKMKIIYKDVVVIQGYIQRRQDAGYRKPIKDAKVKQINDLQKLRLDVLASMKVFDQSLLKKSKDLFLAEVQPYKKKLLDSLNKMQQQFSGSGLGTVNKKIQSMDDMLKTIKTIEDAVDFQKFNDAIKRYIYLKKQIEGK